MIKYAITGNIASGKTSTENILLSLGFKVLDTDKVTHNLLDNNTEIYNQFKDYDVFENEKISRSKLGKLIFSNKTLKEKLEKIIHPLVKLEIEKFIEKNSKENKLFVSVPLLFESDMQNMFDKIILIYANDEIRLQRLIQRNNYTEEYARCRMEAQMSQDLKVKKSDYIIYNNSTIELLQHQISNLIV